MLIKWTRAALASVDEIAGFIAKDNPTRATSFVLELQAAVTQLQAHPGMGRAGPAQELHRHLPRAWRRC
jgi:toxin ParE1/3/4